MTHPSLNELIEQARKWPREGFGEGYWFNAMADKLEQARRILKPMEDCDPEIREWLREDHRT